MGHWSAGGQQLELLVSKGQPGTNLMIRASYWQISVCLCVCMILVKPHPDLQSWDHLHCLCFTCALLVLYM